MKDEVDRDRLIDALIERGVTYLDGGSGVPSGLSDVELIMALAQSDDPRLRLALIPLFLAQPVLASLVPSIVARMTPPDALTLKQRYTVAACLQRFWRTRLSEVIAGQSSLPDWFGAELDLPSLDVMHGKLALYRLAKQMSEQHPGIDFWASFNKTFEHFVRQLEVEAQTHEPAPAG